MGVLLITRYVPEWPFGLKVEMASWMELPLSTTTISAQIIHIRVIAVKTSGPHSTRRVYCQIKCLLLFLINYNKIVSQVVGVRMDWLVSALCQCSVETVSM